MIASAVVPLLGMRLSTRTMDWIVLRRCLRLPANVAMLAVAMGNPPLDIPHVLDDPPPFHSELLKYGERPYWTTDGTRIAFVESNYGDVCEIDLETREVRDLTRDLGDHHSFLRVLVLSNGDYLLIGPPTFGDRSSSRRVKSELWILRSDLQYPPKRLGRRVFEGCGVSTIAPRVTYAVSGLHDSSLPSPNHMAIHVAEIIYGDDGPELGEDRVIYRAEGERHPEPQDFRHQDGEVIMAEYVGNRQNDADNWKCVVKGVDVATGEVRTYIDEARVHNECEGIFPDHEHICLESSCDEVPSYPPLDLWKLKLDGSGRRVRMTKFHDRPPWRSSNSNVSPDGRWLAYMVNTRTDEAGYGHGLGLLDLEAWGGSSAGTAWEQCSWA